MIAMPNQKKRKKDLVSNQSADLQLLTPIRESQLPQLSDSFVEAMISETLNSEDHFQ